MIFVSPQIISIIIYPQQLDIISAWQVRKKNMYWSPRHWIYFKATVLILCLYFFNTPAQIQGPLLYTLLLNYIPPIPHPFDYFLISGYLMLQTPNISGVDRIAVPLTPVNSHWPQHCMYRVGLYTKNFIYTEKFGIPFETQFGYM